MLKNFQINIYEVVSIFQDYNTDHHIHKRIFFLKIKFEAIVVLNNTNKTNIPKKNINNKKSDDFVEYLIL